MIGIQHASLTDVGLRRDNNEDAFLASARLGLWVVADGMGGHAAGEVASAIAIETIEKQIAAGNSLSHAIQQSHQAILTATANGIGAAGMGSTVVALSADTNNYQICWVGDSRAYLVSRALDAEAMELRQLTTDHSYVQLLYQNGAISEQELSTHPEKNIITQCLGSVDIERIQVDQIDGEWHPGDRILLCSDGLSDVVANDTIVSILASHTNNTTACAELIRAALDAGGRDNITVSIISAPQTLRQRLYRLLTKLKA